MKKNAMNNLWKIGELLIISNSVKVGCVVPIVVVSILLHAEFGRNDHPEDAPHFSKSRVRKFDDIRCDNFERLFFIWTISNGVLVSSVFQLIQFLLKALIVFLFWYLGKVAMNTNNPKNKKPSVDTCSQFRETYGRDFPVKSQNIGVKLKFALSCKPENKFSNAILFKLILRHF